MTPAQLSRQVIDLLSGGDTTFTDRFDDRYIQKQADSILSSLVKLKLLREPDFLNAGTYFHVYKVPIVQDTVSHRWYSELPGQILNHNGLPVVTIWPEWDDHNPFLQMHEGSLGIWSGLECNQMEGQKSFWVEGRRAFYHNLTHHYHNKEVRAKMVVRISSLEQNEEIPLEGDAESQLIQGLVQLLSYKDTQMEDVTPDVRGEE